MFQSTHIKMQIQCFHNATGRTAPLLVPRLLRKTHRRGFHRTTACPRIRQHAHQRGKHIGAAARRPTQCLLALATSGTGRQPKNNELKDGNWYCDACKYPPCSGGCGAARPRTHAFKYAVWTMPIWTCDNCRTCISCGKAPERQPKTMN